MTSRPRPSYAPPGAPLPTAEAVALAKGLAARACAAKAAELAWPSLAPAVTWIERTPLVALAVLIGLCPDVTDERLARCLGLDPFQATAALTSWQTRPTWPAEMVRGLIQDVGAG